MLITIVRTFIMYFFVVVALRFMGKRQIGELEASELVVTIIISDIAAAPITNIEVPLISNIIAILVLMAVEVVLSFSAYKSTTVREVLFGTPSTFFKNGKFNQAEMERQRFNVADIMEEVRGNGTTSLDDVEYIIMETNGKISVILKSEQSPVTPKEMKFTSDPVRINYIIIDNGTVIKSCMKRLGLNEKWLTDKLKQNKVDKVSDVYFMSFEEKTGKTIIVPKDR